MEASISARSANFGILARAPIGDLLHPGKLRAIVRSSPYSLLTYERMAALYEGGRAIEKENTPGSVVELGVCNGGSAGILASAVNPSRPMWLLDSWEGMPVPVPGDVTWRGDHGVAGMTRGSEENVRELLFGRLKMRSDRIHLVKGWFDKTLPPILPKIGNIALLHIDCDWYESVKFCLEQLYDRVVPGGRIHIDDYGHWRGTRKAVDEFFAKRVITPQLHSVDFSGVWLPKPRA